MALDHAKQAEALRPRLLSRLRRIWLIGALALVTLGASAIGVHVGQGRSSQWVLHSREVLRTARQTLALVVDRAAVLVTARLTGESAEQREAEARAQIIARLDSLVLLTADNPSQHARATELSNGVRRWMEPAGSAGSGPDAGGAEEAAGTSAQLQELPRPSFSQLRTQFERFIQDEEALYLERVDRLDTVSRAGVSAILLEILLLLLVLRWFRRRAEGQALELLRQQGRMEEQAVELELQIDETRSLARDLETSNRELREREGHERAARAALEAAERRYRTLIEQSLELIAVLDTAARFTYVSESFERVLGYEPSELLGTDSLRFVHPEDASAVAAAFARVRDGAATGSAEYRYRHKSGNWLWVSSIATNLTADPELGGIVVNSRNVTEARQLETQFRQAQKMEAVGRLAGGVAHDFNNLLTSIKLNCQLLQELLEPERPEQEEVREIARAADRASALTRQLLAFSRKQILQPRALDLNESVLSIERMLRRLLGEDIEISTDLAPELPAVLADPGQIEQVLLNLAVNAGDAMPQGGRLAFATAVVELDETFPQVQSGLQRGRYVMLAVSDTGMGMDDVTKSRIFEPFFTTKGPGKGTGLGLSTVYGIMRQSGGQVWVYSEKGRGTTFKLYFPVDDAGVALPSEEIALARPRGGTERVLVVEDEPDLRRLVTRVLASHGYTVTESANGREALELCAATRDHIDLVITDVVMPEMSGREFSERLAEVGCSAKLLYMSGYTDDEILRRGVLDPNVAFLQKPFSVEALLHAVRRALAGRRSGEWAAVG